MCRILIYFTLGFCGLVTTNAVKKKTVHMPENDGFEKASHTPVDTRNDNMFHLKKGNKKEKDEKKYDNGQALKNDKIDIPKNEYLQYMEKILIANCKVCGEGHAYGENPQITGNKLMINGKTAFPVNKNPWMVALIDSRTQKKLCGGAIINAYYILTAAHCLVKPLKFKKQVGPNTCSAKDGSLQDCFMLPHELMVGFLTSSQIDLEIRPWVAKILPHPNFSINTACKSDIGLIKLKYPIPCNDYATPICLPTRGMKLPPMTVVSTAGWGSPLPIDPEGTLDLREAFLLVMDKRSCLKVPFFNEIKDKAFCLIGDGMQSPCFGDSGGPMYLKYSGNFVVLGVTSSHSSKFCSTLEPVVYTSVQAYLDWIYKNMV